MRAALACLAAVTLAGCGTASEDPGASGGVRAVDRPAPDAHKAEAEVQVELSIVAAPGSDPCDEPPAPEFAATCAHQRELERRQAAEERRKQAEHEEAHAPPAGREARVVAELELEQDRVAELVAWRARNGKTCTLARIVPAQERGFGARRVGECVRFMPCAGLCLAVLTTDDRRGVLAGTIPQHAGLLRLVGPEGRTREYELDGPIVDGAELRVFIADLGQEDWWTAELRQGGETIATDDSLGSQLRGLRCADESAGAARSCYSAEPAPQKPTPPDDFGLPEEYSCERQFDENESGFQTCEEGEPEGEE